MSKKKSRGNSLLAGLEQQTANNLHISRVFLRQWCEVFLPTSMWVFPGSSGFIPHTGYNKKIE